MKTAAAVLVLGLVIAVGVAHAGQRWSGQVWVDPVNGAAAGALGSVRNSADSNQYIRCYAYNYFGGSGGTWGYCIAVSSNGTVGSCYTNAVGVMQVMLSIKGDSYVYFRWDTTSSICMEVYVDNGSMWEPKQP